MSKNSFYESSVRRQGDRLLRDMLQVSSRSRSRVMEEGHKTKRMMNMFQLRRDLEQDIGKEGPESGQEPKVSGEGK